jgi:Uma2 family endonuclease
VRRRRRFDGSRAVLRLPPGVSDDRGASFREIVLPQTKPQSEWVRGRPVQKVSGTYEHAALQAELAAVLRPWARGRGRLGTEWRFRVSVAGELARPLVPDLAFRSYDALPKDAPAQDVAIPRGAPSVVFEVLVKHELRADVEDKVRTYLRSGSDAVVIVDPATETIAVHDIDGSHIWRAGETLEHSALPELALDVGALFARGRD